MSSISEKYDCLGGEDRPLISVIMANYRSAPYLRDAIRSVLLQSVKNIEVIVSDDASPDNSVEIIEDIMRHDSRVKLLKSDRNFGPARARNRALSVARGHWIAVVDSDDLLHPKRFEWLLAAATHYDANIVADDLLHFSNETGYEVSYLLNDAIFSTPFEITVADFIAANGGQMPAFGYLKPMFQASILQKIHYDESLKIGEDYDLALRLLFNGAKYMLIPQPFYLYRRHSNSISHRLSEAAVQAMIDSALKLQERYGQLTPQVNEAFQAQLTSLHKTLEFERFVAAVRQRQIKLALDLAINNPSYIKSLLVIIGRRVARRYNQLQEAVDKKKTKAAPGKLAIFLKDKSCGPQQITEAFSHSEQNALSMHVEEISTVKHPVDTWLENQDNNKAQWKRLATMAHNTQALIYGSDEAEFVSGFVPSKVEHIRL